MGIRIVYTHAGKCPCKLDRVDREGVIEWANAVMESGMKQSLKYTPEAIKYWTRHFFDYDSAEHVAVCQILLEEFGTTPAAILDFDFKNKNTKPAEKPVLEEIADIDSFAVGEDEGEDEEDIKILKKKKKNDS